MVFNRLKNIIQFSCVSVVNKRLIETMADGMYYLFDLNNKIIRKQDDYSKLPDILKNDI